MNFLNQRNLIMAFLCLGLMTSCAKEEFLNEPAELATVSSIDYQTTESSKGGGDNENENHPDVIVTVNDENNVPKTAHLIVMYHDNNGSNGNGNPIYKALTTSTGVALLNNLDTGNYTLDVYDEEEILVYTTFTSITENKEMQIILD